MDPYSTQNSVVQDSVLGSKFFNPEYLFTHGVEFFQYLWQVLITKGLIYDIFIGFAVFFLTVIAYTSVRLLEIRAKEKKHLEHEIAEYAHHQVEIEKKKKEGEGVSKNERWRKVIDYIFSVNSADWKLAIIEADAMLDSLMNDLGFKADTLGEKLKMANQENFRNLTAAWEVHNIRNKIAHEGSSFDVSSHEAKRVIALYEQIFREFGFI